MVVLTIDALNQCASMPRAKFPCRDWSIEPGRRERGGLLQGIEAGTFYWFECIGREVPVEIRYGEVRCIVAPEGEMPDSHPYLN